MASPADADAAPPPNPPHKGEGLRRLKLAPDAIQRARHLRKNMTGAEKLLWNALREAFPAAHFRHQVPFGPYTADFCSHGLKLIVEVDGGQHALRGQQDAVRTRFLVGEGYRSLRFWNHDVLDNCDGVLAMIASAVAQEGRA